MMLTDCQFELQSFFIFTAAIRRDRCVLAALWLHKPSLVFDVRQRFDISLSVVPMLDDTNNLKLACCLDFFFVVISWHCLYHLLVKYIIVPYFIDL